MVNPDSVPITFSWVASGGSISGTDTQALWVAPQSTGEYTISVTVKDSKGRTSSGSIGVHVQGGSSKPAPAPAPTPTAPQITGLTADPTTTAPGGSSSITAKVANPDSVPLTFSWVASGGSITGAQAQALWVAPQSTGEFTISVIAKDSYGRTANGSIGVSVQTSSPAPAPTPTPTGTRDPATWPFDKLSPWNRPIGAGAVYKPVVGGLGGGFTNAYLNYSKWTTPYWIATDSDPLRKIYYNTWEGTLPSVRQTDAAGTFIWRRVPDNAGQSVDEDGNCVIFSSDHLTSLEMYRFVRQPDGTIRVNNASEVDLKGTGIFGILTNGMSLAGGPIRAGELRNGINHVLFFATDRLMWNRNGPGGRPFVWPSRRADGFALQPPPGGFGTTGNLYMGSWVAIPPSVNINALGLETAEGLVLARAMLNYGAIGVSSGDVGRKMVFRFDLAAYRAGDLNSVLANWAAFQRDLTRIALNVQLVSNSHNNGQAPTLGPTEGIGGGAPRTSFAPDFPSGQDEPIGMVVAAVAATGILRQRSRPRRTRH